RCNHRKTERRCVIPLAIFRGLVCPRLTIPRRSLAALRKPARSESATPTSRDTKIPQPTHAIRWNMLFTCLGTRRTSWWWTSVAERGEEVVPLRYRGARVIGMDISPHLIAIARERLQRYGIDAELQIASAYETRLTDQSVDVVFCMSVLHHLQLDRVKNEIRRILKPDGLFILKEPVRFSKTMERLRKLFAPREDVSEFEHPLNSKELNSLAEGFQVRASGSFRTP